jgi:hypothetical protein
MIAVTVILNLMKLEFLSYALLSCLHYLDYYKLVWNGLIRDHISMGSLMLLRIYVLVPLVSSFKSTFVNDI